MAFDLSGNVEILRIVELLTKVLSSGDLANYYVAIDNGNDSDTKRVSLADILAFVTGGGTSFADNVFEIFSVGDSSKKINFSASSISTSTTITLTVPDISGLIAVAGMTNAFSFGGQAHGGNSVEAFSASKTFDAEDGNNQEMDVTAATTIGITNELPGTYIFTLEIDSGASPAITVGASFGTLANDGAALSDVDDDINVITLVVRPNATKYYTITTVTP